jgi:tetratricopeptide (TPR) repeat protein
MRTRLSILSALLLLAGFSLPASAKSEPEMEQAAGAYEKGDYPTALGLLQRVVSREPNNGEAHLLLAKTYFQMQDRDRAVSSAERAVSLDPDNSVFHEWLGRAYGEKASHASWFSALGLAKRSRKEFERAVQLDERNFAAMQALIEYDCSAPGIAGGGEDKARPEIARIAALDAAEGHYAAGNCRRQKKDFAVSDEEFTKALDSDPKSPNLIYDIGDYAVKRAQPDRLLAVAQAGERVAPSDPRGKFYRAVGHILKLQKLQEAGHLLAEYLRIAPVRDNYPSPSSTHYWMGRALEAQGQFDAARKEYQMALSLNSDDKLTKEAMKRLPKS